MSDIFRTIDPIDYKKTMLIFYEQNNVLVRIFKGGDIFVPNAFIPNGDGSNDRMYPILVGMIHPTHFRIFNRWEQLMHETSNADPLVGWNVMFAAKTQPMDTYTWTAEALDTDNNKVIKTGNCILIR